jgi:hypothetical protein
MVNKIYWGLVEKIRFGTFHPRIEMADGKMIYGAEIK